MSEFLIFNHRPLSEIQYYINTVPLQKPKSKNPAAIQKTRVEKQKYVQFPIVCIRGSDFVKCDIPVLCERQRSVTALWIGTCFWNSTVSGRVRPGLWSVASLPILQLCSILPWLKVHHFPKLQDPALLLPLMTGKGNRCGGNLIGSSSWIILQWSGTSSFFLMTGISRICDEGSFPLLRDYSQSTSDEKNLDSGQDRSQSAFWSAVKVSDYRRRLGLHRPGKMA